MTLINPDKTIKRIITSHGSEITVKREYRPFTDSLEDFFYSMVEQETMYRVYAHYVYRDEEIPEYCCGSTPNEHEAIQDAVRLARTTEKFDAIEDHNRDVEIREGFKPGTYATGRYTRR